MPLDQRRRQQKDRNRPLSLAEMNAGGVVARIVGGEITLGQNPVEIRAAAEGDGADVEKGLPKFSMQLYSGGTFRQWWSSRPLVLDLAGMELPTAPIPATGDHNYWAESTVGHIDRAVVERNRLVASGVFSGVSELRDAIVQAGRNGFPWQASMGADVRSVEEVGEGVKVTVNGQSFTGPIYVIRQSRLREGAFTQLGADSNTSATIAAIAASHSEEELMDPVSDTGTAPGTVAASNAAPAPAPQPEVKANGTPDPTMVLANERKRVADIMAAAADYPEISAKAVAEGWDINQTNTAIVAAVRAGREKVAPFAINQGRSSVRPTVAALASAVCLANGSPEQNVIRQFGQQAVEAADANYRRIGLRELVRVCAQMDGIQLGSTFGDGTDFVRAAASSISLPNVLESAAKRTLLDFYRINEVVAMQLCAKRPVSDFKSVGRVQLLSNGKWEKVDKDGKLKHGRLGENSFSAQADTRGEIVTLTRQDIINDDLGAFLQLFQGMGMAAMHTIDSAFVELLLSTSIIDAGNGNLISGGTTVFSLTSLATLHEKFRKMKAGPGGTKEATAVNVLPRKLLVPPELEIAAAQMLGSQMLITGANSTQGASNPFAGRYSLHSHPLLSDSAVSGYSTTAFFLFSDPAQVGAFELSLLNGIETPTLMRSPTPAGELGISFVGYMDFGVSAQDYRGVAKSAGA